MTNLRRLILSLTLTAAIAFGGVSLFTADNAVNTVADTNIWVIDPDVG